MKITTLLFVLLGAAFGYFLNAVAKAFKDLDQKTIYSQKELLAMFGQRPEQSNADDDMEDEETTRIVIAEGKAYWIEDNTIMVAPVDEEDNIDFDLAVEYNAIEAPRSELRKVMFILDNLKEDT